MTSHLTKRQFILQVWRKMGTDLVGGIELQRINEELVKKFGPGGAESPAALARVLADEGAVTGSRFDGEGGDERAVGGVEVHLNV